MDKGMQPHPNEDTQDFLHMRKFHPVPPIDNLYFSSS